MKSLLAWILGLLSGGPVPPPPDPTPAPTPPPTPTPADAGLAARCNEARARRGLPPLAVDARLAAAAQGHAQDMAAHVMLSHTGSDGSGPADRIERAGYAWAAAGECIAAGQPDAAAVAADWGADPAHRAILLGDYTQVGTGRSGNYWVADFASEKG
jgi:uncharacterized protein YkwD